MTDTPPPLPAPASRLGPRVALALILVLAVAGFYASGLYRYLSWESVRGSLGDWQTRVAEDLPLAALVYFAVYVTATALSLPAASLLTMIGGALFGRWLGTGLAIVAATVGATLAFLGSRYLLRDFVRRKFGARLQGLDRGIEKDGAFYLLTLRLVPAVPFFLVNLGVGLTPIRTATFALVSGLGMLPGTFLFVNAGTELGSVDSPADLLSWKITGSLALLAVVPLVVRRLLRRGTDRSA